MSRSRGMSCDGQERQKKEIDREELRNQYEDDLELEDDSAELTKPARKSRPSTLSPVRNRRGRSGSGSGETIMERIHRSLSPGTKRRQHSRDRNGTAAATTPSRRMPRRKVRENDPKEEDCMEDFEWDEEEGNVSRLQQKHLALLCKEFELFET
jgi:hypothetical protein